MLYDTVTSAHEEKTIIFKKMPSNQHPMSSLSCKHKQIKSLRGTLHIEIRYFDSKIAEGHEDEEIRFFQDDVECSICFVENLNKLQTRRRQASKNSLTNYFLKLNVHKISIPVPTSYEELQQLLAVSIPKSFGPAVIERFDGSPVYPDLQSSSLFKDGETIIFREIRPSIEKDFDIQNYYKQLKQTNIGKIIESLSIK